MTSRALRPPSPCPAFLALLLATALTACGGGADPAEAPDQTARPVDVSGDRMRALAVGNAAAALARWEPLVNLPIVPAAGAPLANGQVLLWSAQSRNNFATNGGHTYTALFDPAKNTATERDVRDTGHEMFCPGTSRLPDGRLLVTGGSNANVTSLYDPLTNAWTRGAPMNIPRAYNANTVLSDGSVLTLGGSWNPGGGGKTAEVYAPQSGWRVLSGVPYDPYFLDGSYRGWQSDSHVSLLSTGNGRVLMAGPSPNMAWIDTRGNGSSQPAGRRGDDQPALAQTVVMYDAGKVLKAGGATWNSVGTAASSSAYLIDTTGSTAAVKKLAPMAYPRVYANSVVLPNGQVVVIGGQTIVQEFSDSNAVLAPEIWDPQTETFTVLPAMAVARNYHSIAMLLPDGRVLSAGGGLCACAADKPNLQLLSPPYLRNADGSAAARPVITAAPSTAGYGTTMTVAADASVASFAMVRLGAVTHTVNSDQRRVALRHTRNADGSYSVAVPTNAGILLPGQWMLFAMNAAGTPSVAKIVTIDLAAAPTLENPGNIDLPLGGAVNLTLVGSTRNGTLRFGASGLPTGVTIDAATGRLGGTPGVTGSFLVTLTAGNGSQTVSTDLLMTVTAAGTGTGLLGQYHNGRDIGGVPVLQRTEAVDFDWGGAAPGTNVPADNFSVRWTGWLEATATGGASVRTVSDDGVRLWIDDRLVIDNWTDHGATADTAVVTLVAGQRYRVTMEYYEAVGGAVAQLLWQPAGASGFTPVPVSRLYPAAAPSTSNLALGRPSTQSSIFETSSSSRAVDGNTAGNWSAGTVSHTQYDTNAWWQVDLGEQRRIDLVHLWNRTDCCGDRLQNFTVFISPTDMSGRGMADLLGDPAVLKRSVGATRAQAMIGIPVYGVGRHVRVQLAGTSYLQLAEVQVFGGPGSLSTPTIAALPDQNTVAGTAVELTVGASDPEGQALSYSANNLPAGLSIDTASGRITGNPTTAGSQRVTVTATNTVGNSATASFTWTVLGPLPTVSAIDAPLITSGTSVRYAPTLDGGLAVQYSWNFGDGSADTPWVATAATSHTYAAPGVYSVTLTVRAADGRSSTTRFAQAVVAAGPGVPARASTNLMVEPRVGASARLWVVNQDNDSVSVFDTATRARLAEIPVGAAPRSLARANDGRVWVVNKQSATVSVISASSLAVVQTVALPRASQPFGIVMSPADGSALVTLEGLGRVVRLDGSTGAERASQAVGDHPRHLAMSAAGDRLLVSRYITPPLPGEGTAAVDTAGGAAEVLELNPATLAPVRTLRLAHGNRPDGEAQGRGIPNYLGAAAISPDGRTAWVPSKQDNIARGLRRDGKALDFQNTVRAISSRIDLASGTEDLTSRVDHDNSSVASAAIYHPGGAYLFVALETSRQVAVLDAAGRRELFRFEAGLAPQGLAVSADGLSLYVNNLMSRSVSVIDLGPLVRAGSFSAGASVSWPSVATERLGAAVLRGKQLFYDARDPRLARDSYMSCASCHNDAGHDGRTWDFSGFGEGLRNTPALKGRAGTGQGFVHWSANFDEVQDFEGQIRSFAGGTGLMSDAQFNSGTRNQPLGDRKAGVSTDLDALAAYLDSLSSFDASPYRNADGTLSAAAQAGATVFASARCASCHAGSRFTLGGDGSALKNIGTIRPTSGQRLGGALSGIDVPTLRDVWKTAPYLHDGSASTLAAAVQAHQGNTVAGVALDNLVAYLKQIDTEDGVAPGTDLAALAVPPSSATACANENQACTVPAGSTAIVWFGAGSTWARKTGVTGAIGCDNATFGDPLSGTAKRCVYHVTGGVPGTSAKPSVVVLANPDFEAQAMADGVIGGPPSGWAGGTGTYIPSGLWYAALANTATTGTMAGPNVGYLGGVAPTPLQQTTGTETVAGTRYWLTVALGGRTISHTFAGAVIELLADGAAVASQAVIVVPVPGSFADVTVGWTAPSSGAALGVRIRAIDPAEGAYVDVDNVRLTQAPRSPLSGLDRASDFDGDGWPDIVWQNLSSGSRYLWLMNAGTFLRDVPIGTVPRAWRIAGTGDFNGDGRADLLWQNTSTGDCYVWFMNGTAFSSDAFLFNLPAPWKIAATGDFNNDGWTDIVLQNASTGSRYIWFMRGTSYLGDRNLGQSPPEWSIVASGDFNADGQTDLVLQNTRTGLRWVWFLDNGAYMSGAGLGVVGTDWSIAGAADFNGDGKPDLLWQNAVTGSRYLWLMNGVSYAGEANLGYVPVEWSIVK